jgi:hypothetical protein
MTVCHGIVTGGTALSITTFSIITLRIKLYFAFLTNIRLGWKVERHAKEEHYLITMICRIQP